MCSPVNRPLTPGHDAPRKPCEGCDGRGYYAAPRSLTNPAGEGPTCGACHGTGDGAVMLCANCGDSEAVDASGLCGGCAS